MKIQIAVPDTANYGAIHSYIARTLGHGIGNENLPLEISQADCTTHEDNYTLLASDREGNRESWSVMCVLTFKHRPFVPPPRPENPPLPTTDETEEAFCKLVSDWEEQRDSLIEDEERAIFRALEKAGYYLSQTTALASYSPTGRGFSNGPIITCYEKHILVTQSGGLDC